VQDQCYYLQFTLDVKRVSALMDQHHKSDRKVGKIVLAYLRTEMDCWSIVNDLRRLYFKLRKQHLQIAEADAFTKKSVRFSFRFHF
jgi:hypothetical protein